MDDELLDWELLHGSDTESADSNKKSGSSSVIDDDMILFDHYSADNLINQPTDLSQYGVIEPGDSSRVDYWSDRRQNQVDLGFDQFNVDACVSNELGVYDLKTGVCGDDEVRLSDFEAADVENNDVAELTGGTLSQYEDTSKCFSESDALVVTDGRNVEMQSGVEEPLDDSSKSWSDSGGNELVSGDSGIVNGDEEIVTDNGVVSTVEVEAVDPAVRSGDEGKNRETVWWKMPFVLLKYCVFRIGPVWSVSMAAAVMGLILLGRRLHNMKKKAQRFHLKVTIDDKKVSQVMSQAARLNEVFTEVRRVPVICPALPSPVAWPALSLR